MSDLVELFKESILRLTPDFRKQSFVLAVSGGADSIALMKLARLNGLNCIVAHCNFHLRGDEADADANFVDQVSKQEGYKCYQKNFDTKAYAEIEKISIQMAARELRYNWFEELRVQLNYDYILVAHHRDDLVETMLINLIRGTGIKGICGMPEKNENVLRPMLEFSRADIEMWLDKENQAFRNDSSNAQTKYLRNKVRHNIIPEFLKADPDFMNRMLENSVRFRDSVSLLEQFVEDLKTKVFRQDVHGDVVIDVNHKLINPSSLFELLREYGFNRQQIEDLFASDLSGKKVFAGDYVLIADRKSWRLCKNTTRLFNDVYIHSAEFEINAPIHLKADVKNANDVTISKSSDKVEIDMANISFPLIIRKWKYGDSFHPLGMKGTQKLSDFFINRKLSVGEKDNVLLLCSGDDIVWVIGMQLNDKYKVKASSKELLCIQIIEEN